MCVRLFPQAGPGQHWQVYTILASVPEPEPPGAATFRVEPDPFFVGQSQEPEPFFKGGSGFLFFGEQKKKALCKVTKHD